MSAVECFTLFDMMHITELFHFFIRKKDINFSKSFYNSLIAKNRLVLNVRDSATLEEEKSFLINCCATQRYKFSADRFLVNKWLFAKTNEYFRPKFFQDSFRTKFVRHYEDYILRNFASRLNLNKQRVIKKKSFPIFLLFFLLN